MGQLLTLRASALDEGLWLQSTARSGWGRDRLWNLKILATWMVRREMEGERPLRWITAEVVRELMGIVERRVAERRDGSG